MELPILKNCKIAIIGLGYVGLPLAIEFVQAGFNVIGADVSDLAIDRGRKLYPNHELIILDVTSSQFSDFLSSKNPDILFFCHVTWCIISKMNEVMGCLKKYSANSVKDVYIAHLTSIYPPGIQKLGADKFTNSKEVIQYINPSEIIYAPLKID